MLMLKIVSDLICGFLNALGGYHFLWMRRFIMPAVIAVSAAVFTHVWWVVFLPLPAMGALSLGYFGGTNFGHALRLFICAIALGLGLTVTGHLIWYVFAPYAIGSGIMGGISKNWQQIIGDFICGCYLGGIIFFVK